MRAYTHGKDMKIMGYSYYKIGIEETSEVLRNYLKRKDRQIDRLYTYAKMLPFLLAWCVLYRPEFILFCTP